MKITVEIPESIANDLKLPEAQVDSAIRKELAYALYGRGIASLGLARRLAEVSKWEFLRELQARSIPRQFDDTEWDEELKQSTRARASGSIRSSRNEY